MMHYYKVGEHCFATSQEGLGLSSPTESELQKLPIHLLIEGDPISGRRSFCMTHSGQALRGHTLATLDRSRLEETPLDPPLQRAMEEGRLIAINQNTDWKSGYIPPFHLPHTGRKNRLNLLAVGDVGATLLMGLKLMGGDVISSIGICDISDTVCKRWEFELGQISLPWEYEALPEVHIVSPENLFDCDIFLFVASKGIPPVGSGIKDVRMAQYEQNSQIVRHYAKQAREVGYQGLWGAVSDPVDPLAKCAYLYSNQDENGNFDGKGLKPEQVHGFGLGVMNARAAYYAKKEEKFSSFLTEGRSFGPHGTGLWVANSVEHYDEELSKELTHKTVTANLAMRELGFKPYVAPAFSSGALSVLLMLRGEWHCGSVFLDGVYFGVKNRYTPHGIQTELIPQIPDPLYAHLEEAVSHLKELSE
ncbi:MAG: lactate dehydrogenase [Eubacteriales bacterium]